MITREGKNGVARQFRQGDVFLIERQEKVRPVGEKQKLDKGRLILEYGEVTGHAHAIAKGEANLVIEAKRRWLEVCYEKPAVLRHEEHAPIELPADTCFEVRRQRTWSVLEQMSLRVLD